MEKNILFEDNHLLVVNKPSGMLTQGDKTGDRTVLDYYKSYIKEKYNKPGDVFLAPIHRLDRPVSGCLILGRTSKGISRMTEQFKNQKVSKTYLALTTSKPDMLSGHLEHYLLKDPKFNRTRVASAKTNGAKLAVLDYELLGVYGGLNLIKVEPKTGRSHQIRTQLSHIKCPIIGDVKYGGEKIKNDESQILLHCYRMKFIHPVSKEVMTVKSALPKNRFWNQMKSLITII